MKKLWTGKTPRQELVSALTAQANACGESIAFSLESVLYEADKTPDGSPKREMLRYWDEASGEAQQNVLREARRIVKRNDRLMGRKLNR
jgi:hypothetical protein